MVRALKRLLCLFFLCVSTLYGQDQFDGGIATSHSEAGSYHLANRVIDAKWTVERNRFKSLSLASRQNQHSILIPSLFSLRFADGRIVRAEELHFIAQPVIHSLAADANASRASDRVAGKEFAGALEDESGDLRVELSLVLRDGSSYLREIVTISAPHRNLVIDDVRLIDLQLPEAQISGTVAGSPIINDDFFLGFEHPLSTSAKVGNKVTAELKRTLPLLKDQSITYSSVIGVAPLGQMRRAFLTYIERERAHPYRTFLHYNTWYDLGYFTPYDQASAVDRIDSFGRELHDKRGVTLDSVLFDDGWDNHASLWKFNQGFPDGFAPIREATNRYGFSPGVWMSPWGGYSKPKQERIQFGRSADFEIVDGGYALSGPKYYDSFRDVCLEMIRKYGVNQFKFDGTGNADRVFRGSRFDSDFDAMIHLIGELRHEKPDIYINLTTGTTASPFWLLYADSIWRGGEDQELAGVGNNRERWITYRDADTYAHIVSRGPLYPLNSLMLHGIIYARYDDELNTDPGNDFANEVHSYFGSGTQLQEMYLTPSLLSTQNWDTLAEAANWSRGNASILKDTHWIGGDPAWLNVYGWASWTPKKGILVLRNPSDKPQSITLDLAKALELPDNAPRSYLANSPWKTDAEKPGTELNVSAPYEFKMAPFEVKTLELLPK